MPLEGKKTVWSLQVKDSAPVHNILALPKYEMFRTAKKDQVASTDSLASTGLTTAVQKQAQSL